MSYIIRLSLSVASVLLVACVSNTRFEGVPPDEARIEIEAAGTESLHYERPLIITAAAISDASLLIAFEADGQAKLARGLRKNRQNISTHINWFPVYHMLPVDSAVFDAQSATVNSIAFYQADIWDAFQNFILEQLTPQEDGAGALINYRDIEYIWYRSGNDSILGTDLKEKPAEVSVARQYRIEAMTDSLFDILERFLAERGITDRRLILATGETGSYSRPFVAIDRDARDFGFLSLEPFTFGDSPNNYAVKGGRLGDHVVRSYVIEPINRPFTFVSRLFFLLTDSIADISRRVYVNRAYPDIEDVNIPAISSGPGMDLDAWEHRLDKLVGSERFSGSIEILVDGDEYFPRLIESVLEATESVKMRTYIFDNDDYATAIADMLKRRSDDVDVQVMIDGLGTLMAQGASAGTVPVDYEAPLAITKYLESGSEIEVRGAANPWATGDHSKTTIIDSAHAYIGGMNIGREYRWEWHDMMMRVEGSIVRYIEREFDKTWAHRAVMGDFVLAGHTLSNPMPESDEVDHPIRPLLTLPRRSEIYKAQVEAIRNSRSYIYVQNAYLSDAVIIHELVKARLRGVDVRVIIPMEGNHGVMNANNVVAANTLMKYGVRVFAYPGMSHIKAAIYDGWACAGSANFDKLSFQVNKEMNLGSSDPAFVRDLIDKVFDPDFATAAELREPLPSGWKNTFASIVASQL
ncbi:MAG: phosphatidylserine/phosphatidylglycerophosphate/cardiolipin synthase family protein [Proteobacteria bacterium]|nr:phosphatidylserine/phosphatidylglycerophosphate/cardiolipin synthase family protein [Pseudomonadota bacterium]